MWDMPRCDEFVYALSKTGLPFARVSLADSIHHCTKLNTQRSYRQGNSKASSRRVHLMRSPDGLLHRRVWLRGGLANYRNTV